VAIFGAAGAIGKVLADEFERRFVAYRVVGRTRARLDKAFGKHQHAEIFEADLNDLRSAGAAAREIDTIVYCVGLPYPSHSLHPVLMRASLQAAVTMKVKRLVVISNVYSYGVPRAVRVAETHPRFPVARKGAYRVEQEDMVLAAHKKGDIQALVVRLSDFYGPHADIGLANPIFRAALAGKTANWIGPVNTPHEFVYVPDTAPAIADLACCDDCYGEAWNIGGAGDINTLDFITRVYRAVGRAPKYRVAGRTLLQVLGWFSPMMRELPEMLYLQETPVILDDSKLLAKFPGLQKTPYDAGIGKTFSWIKSGGA
ncbi:MAG TPA: NAD-dependent epimerase/dehydratase family protein, partial [Candidatus Sulfopaludibacter sp.]|nr:NAD-dependent epimerase/dehydratase family protein [Candidatus Sulfopaludibacter sp.]